jgi:hypothetical protein
MLLKQRIKKLENKINVKPCFCGKTFIDLMYGKPGADALTYCPNCKDEYDYWMNLARDAVTSENLTDARDGEIQ